ncbi:MAG: hypothetical protein U1F42_00125 [Candidatus Competibacteraceae bacterium]
MSRLPRGPGVAAGVRRLLNGVRAGWWQRYTTANMDEAERCDRVGLLLPGD